MTAHFFHAQHNEPEQPPGDGRDHLAFLQNLALIGALLIGFASFFGLREILADSGGFAAWLIPLALAGTLSALLGGAWHKLLELASRPVSEKSTIPLTLFGGALLTKVHLATSVWFLSTSLGGHHALQEHQYLYLTEVQVVAGAMSAVHASQAPNLDRFSQAERQIQDLLDCEVGGGCVSGTAGDGPVADQIRRALRLFGGQQRGAASIQSAGPEMIGEIMMMIDAARHAAREGDHAVFEQLAARISANLRAVGGVSSDVSLGNLGSFSSIPEVQDILRGLQGSLSGPSVLTALPQVPEYEPIDRAKAVWVYADRVPFAWAVAVAVDSLNFLLLLLMVFSVHLKSREDQHAEALQSEEDIEDVRERHSSGPWQEPRKLSDKRRRR